MRPLRKNKRLIMIKISYKLILYISTCIEKKNNLEDKYKF